MVIRAWKRTAVATNALIDKNPSQKDYWQLVQQVPNRSESFVISYGFNNILVIKRLVSWNAIIIHTVLVFIWGNVNKWWGAIQLQRSVYSVLQAFSQCPHRVTHHYFNTLLLSVINIVLLPFFSVHPLAHQLLSNNGFYYVY